MSHTKEYAIIVAAGSGSRMNHKIPKQFLRLGSMPVLMHTVKAFYDYSGKMSIIIILPEKYTDYWTSLCRRYKFTIPFLTVSGGLTRFQSVRNGLQMIGDQGVVAIHDGVRPLVDIDIIRRSFAIASSQGSAVAAVPLKESIRIIEDDGTSAINRSRFSLIQTPQTFQVPIIKKAYETDEDPLFTDDASVVEKSGNNIVLFEGSYSNIKITTTEDLVWAKALLKKRDSKTGRLNIRPH